MTSSARPFPDRSHDQEKDGDGRESPHGMRSLRGGGNRLIKTGTEGHDRLLLIRQHSILDQDCQTRVWIDAA